jgi:hypothetical protein
VPFGNAAVDQPIYAAAAPWGDGMVFATRDSIALRFHEGAVVRLPLPAVSDQAPAVYISELVVGRVLLVLAALDGRLYAGDQHGGQGWQTPAGALFVAAPQVVGDLVLGVRGDGRLETRSVEDGREVDSAVSELGAPVLAAWPIPGGFAGLTANEAWCWKGAALTRQSLPVPVVVAGERVAISHAGRVLVEGDDGTWSDVGRLEGQPTAQPIAWRGHAVIPQGRSMLVLGRRGFVLRSKAEFLPAAVLGERLVAIDQAGAVQVFDP